MGKQNFISNLLCRLGGDRYTEESTRLSLQRAYDEAQANIRELDIHRDKFILFSDLHRGAKNGADDFLPCEAAYCAALAYYFEMGYTLCVMGDAEELWEEYPEDVLRTNDASFFAEKLFHENGRYLRLWGNHDEIWGEPSYVKKDLQRVYGNTPLQVHGSILLKIMDDENVLGEILLVHGHQGTQNEGNTRIAKWFLHNIWRPLQRLTRFSCNTPATDWRIRDDRDKIIYNWTSMHPGLVLIAGHTHTPVYASRSHRLRLIENLSAARERLAQLDSTEESLHAQEMEKVARLSAELEWCERKMSTNERKASPPLENPKPCYFNTGCCCFFDGDITGIEIADGEIRLIRWPDDNGWPIGKILQAPVTLEAIFDELR
jgi:predicted phosphodiesterase